MDDLQSLLATKEFWFYYQGSGVDQLDAGLVQRFAPKKPGGEYDPLTIRLECASPYAIEIEVTLDYYTVNLSLTKQDKSFELGWWDDARWHPFALRWQEVGKLMRYWAAHPTPSSVAPATALLLLARFVGNGVDEGDALRARRKRVAVAYRQLGIFSISEIKRLLKNTLLRPSEDDYRWRRHRTLGWVFGGEYPCYSIRNEEHADGGEGRFPFVEWKRVLARISET
jgi:hypothetical protein